MEEKIKQIKDYLLGEYKNGEVLTQTGIGLKGWGFCDNRIEILITQTTQETCVHIWRYKDERDVTKIREIIKDSEIKLEVEIL